MITAKELQQRRLACVGNMIKEIETLIIKADDQGVHSTGYSVLGKSRVVIDELMYRLKEAGYKVTRKTESGRLEYDQLVILWD